MKKMSMRLSYKPHSNHTSSTPSTVAVGLRILTQQTKVPSNIVVRYIKLLAHNKSKAHQTISSSRGDLTRSLQSCRLRHKKLSHNKDVYMCRGDQGFCSEERRDRQVLMDEMREQVATTKKAPASSRHCYPDGPKRETRLLLRELLQRRNQIPICKTRAITS